MNGFPDRASVEKLRCYGIRTVVLHLQMPRLPGIVGYAIAEPPDAAAAAAKPIAGLGRHAPSASARSSSTRSAPGRALHGSD